MVIVQGTPLTNLMSTYSDCNNIKGFILRDISIQIYSYIRQTLLTLHKLMKDSIL